MISEDKRTMPNKPQLLEAAKQLRKQGLSYRAIGKRIGVPNSTVGRWLNPEANERHLERIRKRRRERYAIDPDYAKQSREKCRKRQSSMEGRCKNALSAAQRDAKQNGHTPCIATVEQLTEAFDGYCHCCGVSETEFGKRLAMDHDHTTGEFRGWLCSNCNTAIGKLRDDPYAAFHYLDSNRAELLFKLLVRSHKPRKVY